MLTIVEREHGLSTEQFPVSAYVGSSKNIKELKTILKGGRANHIPFEGQPLPQPEFCVRGSPVLAKEKCSDTEAPLQVSTQKGRCPWTCQQLLGLCAQPSGPVVLFLEIYLEEP